jgi:hypothetical protein
MIPKISKQSEFSVLFRTGHSSLILLFDCMNGADQTGPINTRTPGAARVHLQVRTRGANWSEYQSCVGGVRIRTSRSTYLEVRMPLQSGPTVSL